MDELSAFEAFSTKEDCLTYLEKIRWNNVPTCPYCGLHKSSIERNEKRYKIRRYHCNMCNTTYSVLVNTVFQDTKVELQKWFLAISLIANKKKRISSRQLANCLQINHKTAWAMQKKICRIMRQDDFEYLKEIIIPKFSFESIKINNKREKND
jgi:transposase-like protein